MRIKQKLNDQGFAHLVIVLVLAVVLVIALAVVGWKAWDGQKQRDGSMTTDKSQANHSQTPATAGPQSQDPDIREVEAKDIVMKSVGFNLGTYDPATNRAGDMVFTKEGIPFDQIWGDFGQQDPRSPNDQSKRNPQPTYILPLGTKVQSLIDGYVTKVDDLYSGDMTIWVSPFMNGNKWFEHEHVINPSVKVGDKVTSGQAIAEVSTHDSQNHPGFGILEVGLFEPIPPSQTIHSCLYQYIDKSVRDDIFSKITALHKGWESYIGKDVYPDNYPIPGCISLDPVNG